MRLSKWSVKIAVPRLTSPATILTCCVQGVLKFSTKTAADVLTPLEYVQAISLDDTLDLKLMAKLYRSVR